MNERPRRGGEPGVGVLGVNNRGFGTTIGPAFQGDFAIIQMVQNDPCQGLHGLSLLSPLGGGLGRFAP